MSDQSLEPLSFGVECAKCGGPVYMETCDKNPEHEWAIAGECQRCGERHEFSECADCVKERSDAN